MKVHPLAELFPPLEGEAFEEFMADIKAKGLLDPIVVVNGAILDGRNRQKACDRLGISVRQIEFSELVKLRKLKSDLTPAEYVWSENVERRHLNTAQRASIGTDLLPRIQAEAKKRQVTSTGGSKPQLRTNLEEAGHGRSYDIAAQAVHVGSGTIAQARVVKDADPAAFEKLRKGESTVNAEYKKVRAAQGTKGKLKSTNGTKGLEVRQKAHKRRMVDALSSIRGSCMALSQLDISIIRSACSAEDIQEWSTLILELARTLRKFRADLTGEGNGS